jgi:Alpha/beta hydrolase family
MSIPNIEVAICHGAFGTGKSQKPLIEAFKTHGMNATCPSLPTSEAIARPTKQPLHSDDAIVFRATLSDLILKSGKTVVVLAHSNGGVPGTEAITPELEYSTRQLQGLPGGVIGIFYMAAFVLPPGHSQDEFFMGNFPLDGILANYDFKSYPDKGAYQMGAVPFYIIPKDSASFLFNGLPADEAKAWADGIVDLAGPQLARLTNASYLRLPCAYMFTKDDKTLPLALQEDMVAKAKALGVEFREFSFDGGHSPQLLCTEDVVKNVVEFANGILKV